MAADPVVNGANVDAAVLTLSQPGPTMRGRARMGSGLKRLACTTSQ